jgi:hypothetical protein
MNVSAAIAETEGRIHWGILSSRHDHAKGARPRKRGGDAPGRGWPGVQAGGLAARSVNILCQGCLVSSPQTVSMMLTLSSDVIGRYASGRLRPGGSRIVTSAFTQARTVAWATSPYLLQGRATHALEDR